MRGGGRVSWSFYRIGVGDEPNHAATFEHLGESSFDVRPAHVRWNRATAEAPSSLGRRDGGLCDVCEKLIVRLRRSDLVDQQFKARSCVPLAAKSVEHPAQLPNLLEL